MKLCLASLFSLFASCSVIPSQSDSVPPTATIAATPSPAVNTIPKPVDSARKFEVHSSIGNVELGNECATLLIQNSSLQTGDRVQIVYTDEPEPQKVFEGVLSDSKSCNESLKDPWPTLIPDDTESEVNTYLITVPDLDYSRGYGIGVVNTASRIELLDRGVASADLDGDGKREYFRDFTSNEGAHFTVWSGKPLKGKRIWHSYFHFHYDTEPTCKPPDYRP